MTRPSSVLSYTVDISFNPMAQARAPRQPYHEGNVKASQVEFTGDLCNASGTLVKKDAFHQYQYYERYCPSQLVSMDPIRIHLNLFVPRVSTRGTVAESRRFHPHETKMGPHVPLAGTIQNYAYLLLETEAGRCGRGM